MISFPQTLGTFEGQTESSNNYVPRWLSLSKLWHFPNKEDIILNFELSMIYLREQAIIAKGKNKGLSLFATSLLSPRSSHFFFCSNSLLAFLFLQSKPSRIAASKSHNHRCNKLSIRSSVLGHLRFFSPLKNPGTCTHFGGEIWGYHNMAICPYKKNSTI